MNMLKLISNFAEVCTPGEQTGSAYTYHAVPTFAFSLGRIMLVVAIIVMVACVAGFIVARTVKMPGLAADFKVWGTRALVGTIHGILLWIGLSMVLGYIDSSVMDIVCGGIILAGFLIATWSRFSEGSTSSGSLVVAVYVMLIIMAVWAFIAPKVAPDLSNDFIPKFFYDALYPGSPYCG